MKNKRMIAALLAFAISLPQTAALAAPAAAVEEPRQSRDYIVKLRSDVATLFSAVEATNALGFDMYLVTEAEANELMAAGLAEFAEPDGDVELLDLPSDPKYADQWYLQGDYGINMASLWSRGYTYTGRGIKIGIVDSGLNPEHEDLDYVSDSNPNGHILPGVNFYYETDEDGNSVMKKGTDTTDEVGHGTMVTGIINAVHNDVGVAGVAPGADILPIKCFVGKTTKVSLLVKGIEQAVEAGCDIINVSAGTTTDNASKPMDTATKAAVNAGIIVVASVGNNYTTAPAHYYPASYDQVVGVGAITSSGGKASYSQSNDSVWVTAPGSGIWSLGYTSPDSYASSNGTSFATPIVSALAALVLEKVRTGSGDFTPADFQRLLAVTAIDDSKTPGYDYDYGHGFVNAPATLAGVRDYTITYHLNGGTLPGQSGDTCTSVYHIYDESVTLPTPTIADADYTFGGWYESADCTGTPVTQFDHTQGGDRTFYAGWLNSNTAVDAYIYGLEDAPQATEGDTVTIFLPQGTILNFDVFTMVHVEPKHSTTRVVSTESGADKNSATVVVEAQNGDRREYTITVDTSHVRPTPASNSMGQAVTARTGVAAPASLDGKTPAAAFEVDLFNWFSTPGATEQVELEYELTGDVPVGMTLTGSQLSYTPHTADVGRKFQLSITASDSPFISDPVSLTLTVGDLPYSAPVLVEPIRVNYDTAATPASDLTVEMRTYGAALTSITLGGAALREGIDYTLPQNEDEDQTPDDGYAAVLKGSYLATLEPGEQVFTFHFSNDADAPAGAKLPTYTVVVTGPTPTPTAEPTNTPAPSPSATATTEPSVSPSAAATAEPSASPSAAVTAEPSASPSAAATAEPSTSPSAAVTAEPTATPTAKPTATPTPTPTAKPTATPTPTPTATTKPTATPTPTPTAKPTPTARPTATPTPTGGGGGIGGGGGGGGDSVSATPTPTPTATPTPTPTPAPSASAELASNSAYTLTLPQGATLTEAQAKTAVEANKSGQVVIKTDKVTLTIPANTLSQGADVAAMLPDTTKLTGADGQVVARVDDDGTRHIVSLSLVENGTVSFVANGQGRYEIVDNQVQFTDTGSHWARQAAGFVASHQLFQGTGGGAFSPDMGTSRAMVFTVLARLDGRDVTAAKGESWYARAVAWGVSSGLTDGTDPEGAVSREQLATLLWRYAGKPKAGQAMSFLDAGSASPWAADALAWACEAGIITGKPGNRLDPSAGATRGEVAAIFQRYVRYLLRTE